MADTPRLTPPITYRLSPEREAEIRAVMPRWAYVPELLAEIDALRKERDELQRHLDGLYQGKFYPYKPDIFAATYEAAGETEER